MHSYFHLSACSVLFALAVSSCNRSHQWADAIDSRDEKALQHLANISDINSILHSSHDNGSRWRGMTPLGYAAFNHNEFAVNTLLSLGADVDRFDDVRYRAMDRLKSRSVGLDSPEHTACLTALRKSGEITESGAISFFIERCIRPGLGGNKIENLTVNAAEATGAWLTMLSDLQTNSGKRGCDINIFWHARPPGFEFRFDVSMGFLSGYWEKGLLVMEDGYWVLKEYEHWDS